MEDTDMTSCMERGKNELGSSLLPDSLHQHQMGAGTGDRPGETREEVQRGEQGM